MKKEEEGNDTVASLSRIRSPGKKKTGEENFL